MVHFSSRNQTLLKTLEHDFVDSVKTVDSYGDQYSGATHKNEGYNDVFHGSSPKQKPERWTASVVCWFVATKHS